MAVSYHTRVTLPCVSTFTRSSHTTSGPFRHPPPKKNTVATANGDETRRVGIQECLECDIERGTVRLAVSCGEFSGIPMVTKIRPDTYKKGLDQTLGEEDIVSAQSRGSAQFKQIPVIPPLVSLSCLVIIIESLFARSRIYGVRTSSGQAELRQPEETQVNLASQSASARQQHQ